MNRQLQLAILADHSLMLEWQESAAQSKDQAGLQQELYERFQSGTGKLLLFLAFCSRTVPLSASLDYLRSFAGLFREKLRTMPDLDTRRDRIEVALDDGEIGDLLDRVPPMPGAEYLDQVLLAGWWETLVGQYRSEIKAFSGTASEFILTCSPDIHLVGRVFFHLVESKMEDYPFAFLATYSTSLNQQGKSNHVPLRHALAEYSEDSGKLLELLATVHLAAKQSKLVAGFLESGEIFHPLKLSGKEALTFLREVSTYEQCGIVCRIPNWWKNNAARPRVEISLGNNTPSYLGVDSVLDFDAGFLLGDTRLSEAEVRKLLLESEGLAFLKGKWVEVDPEKLQQTLAAFEEARQMLEGGLSLREALRLQLELKERWEDEQAPALQITHGAWLQSVLEKMRYPTQIKAVRPPKNFTAQLRPYQQQGLNWLHFLSRLGFGACLADDMGLGKTIQLLALLSIQAVEKTKQASLLVLPASLISNWVHEIERFAPGLTYYVLHPSANSDATAEQDEQFTRRYDLVITTYGLVRRLEWLANCRWRCVILDEAQAIKNPNTRQTKAVKKLQANTRIVLTGTPIENRLQDLWSLFDFLNPGLLGTAKEFGTFAKRLAKHNTGYARLKRVISPYILRRLKTDKTVISDLPEKVEMKAYADLGKKQIVLYTQIVDQLARVLSSDIEGIDRKGIILASLMKLKQLCNHPDQYLDGGEYDEKHSGKFSRMREICETIHAKREKMLVFTQFREISEPLRHYLSQIFGHEGLVLHGGTPVRKRKEIVDRFQSHEYVPFLVMTVKAGGVGLNLTAANHVIHFDRWWNPAVENQATDRAFRIGQNRNVVVHKFITRGTIEEKIDDMLTAKAALQDEVIGASGEAWITELGNDQILEMFTLSLQ